MCKLIIDNRIIVTPIYDILLQAQREVHNGKLADIVDKRENVMVSCPCHKNGLEKHASCTVYADYSGDKTQYGAAHCFTCGYTASLPKFIGDCFDKNETFGKEWLLDNFGDTFYETTDILESINLDAPKENEPSHENIILDDSLLKNYDFYHPYMWKRKLTKEVVDEFKIGYDKTRQAITFPVYDENHNLVMVTARCVLNKKFYIPEGVDKPVYLLYDILERNVKKIFICESQINTLTMRTWGYDSVGFFGTGSQYQYNILKKTGINRFILCLDGDEAGRKGVKRFIKAFPEAMIQVVTLPEGKDINDISKEEFEQYYEESKYQLI